tara:strand:- start:120 stop:245 length:126 start_codon:yes stop_codon:yes gene_type:complete
MKPFTMKTNKVDVVYEANELLERQQVLIVLLLLSITFAILK